MNKSINRKQSGFTLAELLIVIVILGVLTAIAQSGSEGASDHAKASAKMSLANEGTKKLVESIKYTGSGNAAPNNPMVHANNDLEDVIFANLGVADVYQNKFNSIKSSTMTNALDVRTQPVDDTSPGVYAMPDTESIVTIVTATGSRKIGWQFTNTTAAEVETLVNKYDSNPAYNQTAGDTTGSIQYSADASLTGLHTLTIVRDF